MSDNKMVEPGSVKETPKVETKLEEQVTDTSAPQKRGPGRPRKNAAPVSPNDAKPVEGETLKRTYKRRAKNVFDSEAKGMLAKQVKGMHQLAALATGIPELVISDNEASMLGDAIATVCEQYDFSLTGKTGALLQLAAAAAMIYAPRVMQVASRVKGTQGNVSKLHAVKTETPHETTPA